MRGHSGATRSSPLGRRPAPAARRKSARSRDPVRVRTLMSREVITCTTDMDLARVGWLLWEGDCGALPVLREGKVVGMITDRDVCMAAAMKPRPCTEIRVAEAMSAGDIAFVRADADLDDALAILAARRVRRLPVLDDEGRLVGLLSINDLLRRAEGPAGLRGGLREHVAAALRAICEPRLPATI